MGGYLAAGTGDAQPPGYSRTGPVRPPVTVRHLTLADPEIYPSKQPAITKCAMHFSLPAGVAYPSRARREKATMTTTTHEGGREGAADRTDLIRRLGSSTFNYWFGYVANMALVAWLVSHAFAHGRAQLG